MRPKACVRLGSTRVQDSMRMKQPVPSANHAKAARKTRRASFGI